MNKVLFAFAVLCCVSFTFAATVQQAICQLQGTAATPAIAGTVTFTFVDATTVTVHAEVSGITTNIDAEHGLHIHQYGDISDDAGIQAGGHWNPAGVHHGCPTNPVRHAGDMGNWTVTDQGTINQTKQLDLITLTGNNSIIGRAVVLHETFDDCVTNRTGNAGSRLATCVIGIANPGVGNTNTAVNGATTPPTRAFCFLAPTNNSPVSGTVMLEQVAGGTRVTAEVTGLTGPHGIHIHEFGDITNVAGNATGGHYNPLGVLHGIPPYPQRHVGDMGNIYHYSVDTAYYSYTNNMISLGGEYSVLGRAIIVHANADNCSAPTGGAGSRLAQCVIGVANPTTQNLAIPANTPITQDISTCVALYGPTESTTATTADGDSSFAAPVFSVGFTLLLASFLFLATLL